MQNPDLTRWLEMVWDALHEEDERKRAGLLHAADAFLQSDQEPDSVLPFSTYNRRLDPVNLLLARISRDESLSAEAQCLASNTLSIAWCGISAFPRRKGPGWKRTERSGWNSVSAPPKSKIRKN